MIVQLWLCRARQAQKTENNQFRISLQHLKENMKDEVGFCLLINVKGFFKFIHHLCSQACPKYLKEQVWFVHFLRPDDKHESLLQTDIKIFEG